MRARPGDRLVVKSQRPGGHDARAKILEARGRDWGPPFLVQWAADGRIELLVPPADAWVEHFSQLEPFESRPRVAARGH
jgi:hypothetical protein